MTSTQPNELRDGIDTPMTLTNRLLSQFSNLGISLYTINFSRIAHTKHKVSASGERNLFYCLTDPPVTRTLDPNLQFGYDERCVWRNLGLHQFEYEHLLLIAAMTEGLSEAYAGAVLSTLAEKYADEDRVKPSLKEWIAMARAIGGLLSTSDFPLVVDDRMRLDPYRVSSGHGTTCSNSLISPSNFAEAFDALAELSHQGKGQLVMAGGNFLGWFAALTEIFLDVNVEIVSRDGGSLHTSPKNSKASLKLVFVEDAQNLSFSMPDASALHKTITVMCSPDAEANSIPRVPFTGRAGWDSLLPKTFDNCFNRLAHQESKMLVQSIGGMARLFEHLAQDPATPEAIVSQENRHNTAALGKGLIQTISNWFPELRHLQARLERLQTLSREEAIVKCNEGAKAFMESCRCTICYTPFYTQEGDPGTLPQTFCLLAVMETILNLGFAMSRITAAPRFFPSRAGVLCIYERQVRKLLGTKGVPADDSGYNRITSLFSADWNANYSNRLQTAVALFSGSWPSTDLADNLIAIRHEGVCAFVVGVQHGDKRGRRRDADFIHVQPGHISYKQKAYDRLSWGPPEGVADTDYTWEAAPCDHISQDLYCK